MSIRALRNNNPGNLNAGEAWQGLMPREKMNADQLAETRFAVFIDAPHGFRAMGIVLLNYERIHGLHTVRQYISRWAPPVENKTDAYVAAVAHDCGTGPDDPFDLKGQANLERIAKAIATHEVGFWAFQDADLHAGISMSEAA